MAIHAHVRQVCINLVNVQSATPVCIQLRKYGPLTRMALRREMRGWLVRAGSPTLRCHASVHRLQDLLVGLFYAGVPRL